MAKKKDEYVDSVVFEADEATIDAVEVATRQTCRQNTRLLQLPDKIESATLVMKRVKMFPKFPWADIERSMPIRVIVQGIPKKGYRAPPSKIELPEETEET
jgi:hypothetical protein